MAFFFLLREGVGIEQMDGGTWDTVGKVLCFLLRFITSFRYLDCCYLLLVLPVVK